MSVTSGAGASSGDKTMKGYKPFSKYKEVEKAKPSPPISETDPLGWSPIPEWKIKLGQSRPAKRATVHKSYRPNVPTAGTN